MTTTTKIYEDMIANLEAARDAATTDGVREGIDGLLAGARKNLVDARAVDAGADTAIGKTIRKFSAIGPCLTYQYGTVVRETKNFYVYEVQGRYNGRDGDTGKVSKRAVHTEPCVSCRDHANTQYPFGYMD